MSVSFQAPEEGLEHQVLDRCRHAGLHEFPDAPCDLGRALRAIGPGRVQSPRIRVHQGGGRAAQFEDFAEVLVDRDDIAFRGFDDHAGAQILDINAGSVCLKREFPDTVERSGQNNLIPVPLFPKTASINQLLNLKSRKP